jgi:hypothetical protein
VLCTAAESVGRYREDAADVLAQHGYEACAALARVDVIDDNLVKTMVEDSGVKTIMAGMRRRALHRVLQREGCGALANVAANNII